MNIIRLHPISDLADFLNGMHTQRAPAEQQFPEAREAIDRIKAKAYGTEDKSTTVIDELTKALFGLGAPVEEPKSAPAAYPAYHEPKCSPCEPFGDNASATITVSLFGPRADVEEALSSLREAIETEISFLKNDEGLTELRTTLNINLHTLQ